MNMQETIEWHPASEPPDNDRTVLAKIDCGGPSIVAAFSHDVWTVHGRTNLPNFNVECWSELPRGPQV